MSLLKVLLVYLVVWHLCSVQHLIYPKLAKQYLSVPSQSNNSQATIIVITLHYLTISEGAGGLACTTGDKQILVTKSGLASTHHLFNNPHS